MAKISTYPIVSVPTVNDLLIGTDVENLNETKNFSIGDIAALIIGGTYVPYIGANANVDLGLFSIEASSFILPGGLSTQFLKADGSLDSTIYQVAGNYITGLSGEATASGPGVANVTLSNGAVIGKVLTGLTVTGGSISASDSILQAFGKLQNQVNSLYGGAIYQGTWNALTNTPTLTSSVGTKGYYYIVNVAGSTVLDGISDWHVGDWAIFDGTAWQQVDNTDTVVSVNGKVGVVVLTTTDINEGTNLYYTDGRARAAITLTTTGSSGASTYNNISGILNVPNYTLSGLGGVPSTRELTINGTTFDLSANRAWSVGTVTSVGTSGPITGGTITGSGTIGITQSGVASDGYLSSVDWNTFNNKQNALTNPVTGTGTIYYLPMWTGVSALGDSVISQGSNIVNFNFDTPTGSTINYINTNGVDYTYTIQMNNFGTRQTYHSYTDGNIIQRINGNDVSKNLQSGQLVLPNYTATGSFSGTSAGYLGFDASGNILTVAIPSLAGYVTGSGVAGQVAYWNGTNSQTGSNNFIWSTASNLLIGTSTDPGYKVNVIGSGRYSTNLYVGNSTTNYPNYNTLVIGSSTTSGSIIDFLVSGSRAVELFVNGTEFQIFTSSVPLNFNISNALNPILNLQAFSAQIGTTTSVASSILTLASTTKGFLPPRMTTTERNAIATPATGLQVYNTTTNTNDIYNGTSWSALASGNIYTVDGTLTGNRTLTHGGFNLTFVGGTHTNRFTSAGRLLLGTTSESTNILDVNGTSRFNGNTTINGTLSVTLPNGDFAYISNDATTTFFQSFAFGFDSRNLGVSGKEIIFRSGIASYLEKMRLTSSGRLLLGTTTESTFLLDVNGTARVSGDFQFGSSAFAGNVVGFRQQTLPAVGNPYYYIYANGDLQRTGVQINHRSDTPFGLMVGTTTNNVSLYGVGSPQLSFNGGPLRIKMSSGANVIANSTIVALPTISNTFTIATNIQDYHDFSYLTAGSFFIGGNGGSVNTNVKDYYFGGGQDLINNNQAARNVTFYATFPQNNISDSAGGNFTITGGRGTGAGIAGDVIFSTANVTTSGTTLQTLVNRWWIKGATGTLSNVASPNASAQLQIDSTTQGFLPPRMTTTQKNAIASPATGLQVYDSTTNAPNYYDGTAWVAMGGGASIYTANGTLTSDRTVASGGFSLIFNPQTTYITTLTASTGGSSYSVLGSNTLSFASGFSSSNIGNVYSANGAINLQTFAGSADFAQANLASAMISVNSIDFSAAGATITMTQASGIRAMTGHQSQIQYQGTNSGTITHAAVSQNLGFYRPSAATGTLTITNAYSHLINDLNDYGTGFTFTNRWGIYQDGASDNNYFKGKVIIGSTNTVGASPLNVKNLPTSSAGLATGDVWNNGGVLNII